MALFQPSVLNKYLKLQDKEVTAKAYKKFVKHFHNATIQENIKNSKEEEYQGPFLLDLFVNILGYTMKPQPKFNLVAEQKNQTNSRKSDGAILKEDNAIAVIELKGTKTKDLKSITEQAFGYKANQKGCIYVITSNYEKLRFYINDATEFVEFNLFTLTETDFELLYLCTSKESIFLDLPHTVKTESIVKEEEITKEFYKDYSLFKRELFRDLVDKNAKELKLPQHNKLTEAQLEDEQLTKELFQLEKNVKLALFKKSQKLIDRFLFIFFAEDRELLPPNSTKKILDKWKADVSYGDARPVYNMFKSYFNFLDKGRKETPTKDGVKGRDEIYAYNGGLFKPDSILDRIEISDELLYTHTLKLSKYDFNSQIDVNILGHIFENSLNEIESVNAEIEGGDFDKQKSKRKKDGVFYTPKYITKYIVENTVGKLCEEKKIELGFSEEDYYKSRKGRKKETLTKLIQILDSYREWLLQLTICDPACGSGAFLNQALDFLIKEHTYIDELKTNLLGGSLVLSDIENTILENNIFGVDLNEESVEIAKLSLWLRTAQPRRKLNNLSSNIKCGNSLIESKTIAGDKAFVWMEQFPKVFEKGGFDVIIGNPPYVDIKGLDSIIVKELFKKYRTSENRINLYSIFIEKGFDLLKSKGFLSFINPNSILVNSSYTKIRKLLIDHMTSIIKLPDGVFKDAIVETIIFEFRKDTKKTDIDTIVYPKGENITSIENERIKPINRDIWKRTENCNYNIYVSPEQIQILSKMKRDSLPLGEIADFSLGITPYDKYQGHSQETIKSREFHSTIKVNDNYKPLISGGNIRRFSVSNEAKEYINYGDWLGAQREEKFFLEPRVLVRQIVSGKPPRIYAGYTEEPLYFTQIGFGIIPNTISPKTLLALINSKLINFYHKFSFLDLEKELFQKILIANCKALPIHNEAIKSSEKIELLVNSVKIAIEKQGKQINSFSEYIETTTSILLTKKLQNWHELEFGEFIKELNKAIKILNKERTKNVETLVEVLTKSDEMEWMELFNSKKEEAQALKTQIDQTDREIDQMVYKLYELTDEEIEIVENS
mgnify:CR=1 FL=1